MAHSWVVRELLTASASLHLVKDKENAAVPLSSNIASTLLNDFPFAEDALSHLTGNKRNQLEKAAILKNPKMAH